MPETSVLLTATLRGSRKTSRSTTGSGRKDLDEVRRWADDYGHTVSTCGCMPRTVLEAYNGAR